MEGLIFGRTKSPQVVGFALFLIPHFLLLFSFFSLPDSLLFLHPISLLPLLLSYQWLAKKPLFGLMEFYSLFCSKF
jgi:hypothetical protein